jgi:hypothetical protein
MANWMTQLREAYQKLIEAELLRGKEAVMKQAELAQRGKPDAIAALARVERVGPMSPSQRPSWRGASKRPGKDAFDTENLGFADAQRRPDPTGKSQSDSDMAIDANISKNAVRWGWASGNLSDKPIVAEPDTGLSDYQRALLKMKQRERAGLPNTIRTEE